MKRHFVVSLDCKNKGKKYKYTHNFKHNGKLKKAKFQPNKVWGRI